MNAMFEKRLGIVWLVLSAITVASYSISASDGGAALGMNAVVTTGVILVSLVKVRLILMEFMEVRHAPVPLQRLADAWLLITGACLLASYFLGGVRA